MEDSPLNTYRIRKQFKLLCLSASVIDCFCKIYILYNKLDVMIRPYTAIGIHMSTYLLL